MHLEELRAALLQRRQRDSFDACIATDVFQDALPMPFGLEEGTLEHSDKPDLPQRTPREAGPIDNATYQNFNKVGTLTVRSALRKLHDIGLLTQEGGGSDASYKPTPQLLNRNVQPTGQNYLRLLLAQRRIAMPLPGFPNSPLQACRSAAVS